MHRWRLNSVIKYKSGTNHAPIEAVAIVRTSCAHDAGRAQGVIADVAIGCDIVVENFRPGILKRLGLSYDDIAAEKPGIIWCCISGFGQEGPYRDRPAYDMIVQAMS